MPGRAAGHRVFLQLAFSHAGWFDSGLCHRNGCECRPSCRGHEWSTAAGRAGKGQMACAVSTGGACVGISAKGAPAAGNARMPHGDGPSWCCWWYKRLRKQRKCDCGWAWNVSVHPAGHQRKHRPQHTTHPGSEVIRHRGKWGKPESVSPYSFIHGAPMRYSGCSYSGTVNACWMPPSIGNTEAVMNPESSLARNATVPASSFSVPKRPNGI